MRCAADAEPFVDFRVLGEQAGLGWRSRLGLLLHPVHGPWIALRAAAFVDVALEPTGPLPAPPPCASCAAPCAAACPAAALASGAWEPAPCFAWQAERDACRAGCGARSACPIGVGSRYGIHQHAYHQSHDRAHVRRALAEP